MAPRGPSARSAAHPRGEKLGSHLASAGRGTSKGAIRTGLKVAAQEPVRLATKNKTGISVPEMD
jgi:hypothetical protein